MSALLHRALGLLSGPAVGPPRTAIELAGFDRPELLFSLFPSLELTNTLRQNGYTHFRYFCALPSYKKPRWLLPIGASRGMLAATGIYLPHRWTARILKSLLIGTLKAGWDSWLRSRVLIASKGPLPLEVLIRDITGEERPIFALSFGRQPIFRKLTIQVMSPTGKILGYMKLPLTDAAGERVRNEATVLQQLWNFPVLRPRIPRVLYAGDWNQSYLLFQSPLEGEAGPLCFDGIHQQFLQTLWAVRLVEKPGQRLIGEIAAKWERAVPFLDGKWRELGQEALRRSTRDFSDKTLRFGVMHGDFAPWNTRVWQSELLLFDWESADLEAPTSWDMFHFQVQTAASFRKASCSIEVHPSDEASFMLYLLSSVCQYLEEGNHEAIGYRQKLLLRQLHKSQGLKGARLTNHAQTA